MKTYKVRILESAAYDLGRLDESVAQRIVDRAKLLAANIGEVRAESLSGNLAGLFKLRVGDHRAIYEILRNESTILIHMVGHRSGIYRKARKASRRK